MSHQILTFYADLNGVVRVEIWRDGSQLGSFGLAGDNGVLYQPGARVQLSTRRLERVARELRHFGEPPYEYRRTPDPHRDYTAADEPQPDTSSDIEGNMADGIDQPAMPVGGEKPSRSRQRKR